MFEDIFQEIERMIDNADVISIDNKVSVRLNISSPAIEYSSFGGGVTVDIINGVAGTIFPIGTKEAPVNNLSDALLIAEYRGFI